MAVKIRLRRMGRKKQPHYRIVVADSDSPRDGRFVESLGYYRPLSHPARLVLDLERADYWLGEGATPSNTVRSLIEKARKGGDAKVAVGVEDHQARKKQRSEALAERRAAEKKAIAEAEAAEKAAREAKAKAAAEEAKAKAAEAEAEKAQEAGEEADATEEVGSGEEAEAAAPEAAAPEEPSAGDDSAEESSAEEEEKET